MDEIFHSLLVDGRKKKERDKLCVQGCQPGLDCSALSKSEIDTSAIIYLQEWALIWSNDFCNDFWFLDEHFITVNEKEGAWFVCSLTRKRTNSSYCKYSWPWLFWVTRLVTQSILIVRAVSWNFCLKKQPTKCQPSHQQKTLQNHFFIRVYFCFVS